MKINNGLSPKQIEKKIWESIKKTVSPLAMDAEERLDGPDRYTQREKDLRKDNYNFDIAVLELLVACEDILLYKEIQNNESSLRT
jgi:hypothetical protein